MTAAADALTDVDPLVAAYLRAEAQAQTAANDDEAREAAARLRRLARSLAVERWQPYPWQAPHRHPDGWVSERNGQPDPTGVCDDRCLHLPPAQVPTLGVWLQLGGRGTGKTEGNAHYVNTHVMDGPPCDTRVPGGHRITIVAPTQADAVTSCVTGVSGLQTINPDVTITTTREGTLARWPTGAVARVLGANTPKDVERLRAWTNVCCVWVEEAAAQVYLDDVIKQARYTLRLGSRAHLVVSTTPKPRDVITSLVASPRTIRTKGRTRDAHRLDPEFRAVLEDEYGGTTMGRQELDAEVLTSVEGALWVPDRPATLPDGTLNPDDRPGIEQSRVSPALVGWATHEVTDDGGITTVEVDRSTRPHVIERTVVAVDPPGGRTEAGIIVAGAIGSTGYVLADLSAAVGPAEWGRRAVQAYLDFGAYGIAIERTYGGDMVDNTIRSAAQAMDVPMPPLYKVPTKVGKRLRAEPVVALYQQGRVKHVGRLPGLEGEQTTWVPDETAESPNRIDAAVHGLTHLLLRTGKARTSKPTGRRAPSTWR